MTQAADDLVTLQALGDKIAGDLKTMSADVQSFLAISATLNGAPAPTPTPDPTPVPVVPPPVVPPVTPPTVTGTLPANVLTMAHEAIVGCMTDGWDSANGGPHVNWGKDASGKLFIQNAGVDFGVHLRVFECLKAIQRALGGPGKDVQIDGFVARFEPLAMAQVVTKPYDKSWAPASYMALHAITGDAAYMTALHSLLKFQEGRIDPAVGVAHGPAVASTAKNAVSYKNAYRVDAQLQYGAFLVAGGTLFGDATMTAAGLRAIQTCYDHAFVVKTGMLARMVSLDTGKPVIIDFQHKAGEQGQNAWSLAIAAQISGDASVKGRATSLLAALKASTLHDSGSGNGGFWFCLHGDSGVLENGYKELARTMTIARAAFLLGDLPLRDEMISCAEKGYWSSPEAGWPYRTAGDFKQFQAENWVTGEAIGIMGDAFFNSGL